MTKGKPIPKKNYPFRPTSKRTGAIILISFSVLLILIAVFLMYASDFADKQKAYEDQWRLMSCEDMKNNYQEDPFIWKVVTMKDLKCISEDEFQKLMSSWS